MQNLRSFDAINQFANRAIMFLFSKFLGRWKWNNIMK